MGIKQDEAYLWTVEEYLKEHPDQNWWHYLTYKKWCEERGYCKVGVIVAAREAERVILASGKEYVVTDRYKGKGSFYGRLKQR